MGKVTDVKPTGFIQRTNAQVYDQGYTFDEPGFIFDQPGIAFGGIFEYPIVPSVGFVPIVRPMIVAAFDIAGTATGNTGQSIGPGWFMYITH